MKGWIVTSATGGEVVFKILRREGALDLLSDLKDQAYDAAKISARPDAAQS